MIELKYVDSQVLYPLLKKAADNCQSFGVTRATIVNISSIFGSVSENTFGGSFGYRESKVIKFVIEMQFTYNIGKILYLVLMVSSSIKNSDFRKNLIINIIFNSLMLRTDNFVITSNAVSVGCQLIYLLFIVDDSKFFKIE